MRKLMTTASLAAFLMAGPALAASDTTQTQTMGSDPARTGSAAVEGSATGGGSADATTGAAPMTTGQTGAAGQADTMSPTTGADAAPGGAMGGTAGAQAGAESYDQSQLHALIGQDVRNAEGDTIGDVNDVVMVDGRPMLVVGVGGFLGIGEREVTVPYEQATMSSDGLQVPMSKDQLREQPQYDADATAGVSLKETYKN